MATECRTVGERTGKLRSDNVATGEWHEVMRQLDRVAGLSAIIGQESIVTSRTLRDSATNLREAGPSGLADDIP